MNPRTMDPNENGIPRYMRDHARFCFWRMETRKEDITKVPYFPRGGGHYKRRPLSLLHQFPNPDTEESGDIFYQLIFGFAESVFPVAACSAYKAECFVSSGL